MLKKIRKAYDNKADVALYSIALMSLIYPVLSGWLYETVGLTITIVFVIVHIVLSLIHGFILITKMFPRVSSYFDSIEDNDEEQNK